MAEQIAQNNEEEEELSPEKTGNFFRRNGKYFLFTVILLVQVGAAYLVISSYYGDIYNWLDGIKSEESMHYTFEDIIINPAQTNGERYLILTVVVEVDTQQDVDLLERESAKIVDHINQILTTKTPPELTQFDERNKLKQEMGIVINEILNKKAVRNLFFTKFVLQ